MDSNQLEPIVEAALQQARQRGFILPSEIRAYLREAGLPETRWKMVVGRLQPPLLYRGGRYVDPSSVSERAQQEQLQQQAIRRAVRRMVKQYRVEARKEERRGEARADFIQPVRVRTEDNREFALLSRDLSTTGIRLIGTQRFLGQKVWVVIPQASGEPGNWTFQVRILWTCAVGDDLFENGGTFLQILSQPGAKKEG